MERCCCLVAEVAVALAGLGAAALAAGLGGRVVDVARGGADEPDHLAREVHPQEEVAAELLHQEGLLLSVWAVAEHLELGGLGQLLAAVEDLPRPDLDRPWVERGRGRLGDHLTRPRPARDPPGGAVGGEVELGVVAVREAWGRLDVGVLAHPLAIEKRQRRAATQQPAVPAVGPARAQ